MDGRAGPEVSVVVIKVSVEVLKVLAEVQEGVMLEEEGVLMTGIVKLRKANPRLLRMKKLQLLKSKLMKSGIKRPTKLVKIKFMRGRMIRMSSLGKIKVILAMRLLMLFVIPPIWLRIGWHVRIVCSSTIPPETVEG